MELLLRKCFWIANLAFLLIAAWLCAQTINVLGAGKLQPLPDFSEPSAGSGSVAPSRRPVLRLETLSKLTGIELADPRDAIIRAAPADGEPMRTSLRIRLTGTTVANQPEWSMANLEDLATNETTVCTVGDLIQGAEVIGIERRRVLVNNNGRTEYIDAEPGIGAGVLLAANDAPSPAGTGAGIRALGDNTYEIARDEVEKAMSDPSNFTQVRLVPAYKNGEPDGFKAASIRPGSLFSKIGLENGDVIRRVNGYAITNPGDALEVYAKLKDASRIEVELERRGSSLRKTYTVR